MKHFYRYLPQSEERHGRGLTVLAAGYHVSHFDVIEKYQLGRPNSSHPPLHPNTHQLHWSTGRTLCEYQLLYITRGRGLFESKNGGLRTLKSGDMFALFPGEWHRYGPNTSAGWDEYWVAFTGRLAAEIMSQCGLSATEPVLGVGVDTRLIEEYLCITDEMRDLAPSYEEIIATRTLLILALARASKLRKNDNEPYVARVIERAKGLMLERMDGTPQLEELADALGISYSWFRRMFRQHTGMSPAQYHLQYRIQRACELLTTTTLPIATIGTSLGFESARYFAAIFKQKSGYSPRDYRARTRIPSFSE